MKATKLLPMILLMLHALLPAESGSTDSLLREKFEKISCLYHGVLIEGLQYYPCADWQIRCSSCVIQPQQSMQEEYGALSQYLSRPDESLVTRGISHYDWIANFPSEGNRLVARDTKVTTETLAQARAYELMKDPYAKDSLLGYISVPRDFALISVGPDGVPDILPFQYNREGKLVDVAGALVEGCELGARASQMIKTVPTTERQPAWFSAELQVPSQLVYDPTNGVKSRGDIVYQASKNRSDCFGN